MNRRDRLTRQAEEIEEFRRAQAAAAHLGDRGIGPYDEIPGFDDEYGDDGFLKRSTDRQRGEYWRRRWSSHR